MFETEANRKIRKEPAMLLELKKGELFPPLQDNDEVLLMTDDPVAELWTFA